MSGPSLRTLLPLLMAGTIAACTPPSGTMGPDSLPVVDAGGSGGPSTIAARPMPKPAHPAPPPSKPTVPNFTDSVANGVGRAMTTPEAGRPASARPQNRKSAEPQAPHGRTTGAEGLVALPAPDSALPPVGGLSRLPSDPVEVTRLRTRPPMTPPVDTAFDAAIDGATDGPADGGIDGATPERRPLPPPAAGATAEARCREAVGAAREAVNHYLHLPAEAIPDTGWVEDALRVTEVAARACQGQPGEEAATYWRATAFFLHGQYARAALNYRRVADVQGPFNALGYAENLAILLQTCGGERTALDAFRMGGLFEAAGHVDRAAAQYGEAARSTCVPLRDTAEARLRVIAERMSRDAATR